MKQKIKNVYKFSGKAYYQDNLVDGSVGRGPKKMSPKWVRALNKVRAAVSLKRKFLKPVWEKHFDDGSGKPYYYNTVTKQSSWEEPATFHSSVPASPSHKKQKGFGFADPTSINRLKKLGDTVSKDDIQHEEERKIKFESLFKACKNGDLSVVKACIKKPSPIDVDDTNIKGSTALHVASEAGHENIVQYLLEVQNNGTRKFSLDPSGNGYFNSTLVVNGYILQAPHY